MALLPGDDPYIHKHPKDHQELIIEDHEAFPAILKRLDMIEQRLDVLEHRLNPPYYACDRLGE